MRARLCTLYATSMVDGGLQSLAPSFGGLRAEKFGNPWSTKFLAGICTIVLLICLITPNDFPYLLQSHILLSYAENGVQLIHKQIIAIALDLVKLSPHLTVKTVTFYL